MSELYTNRTTYRKSKTLFLFFFYFILFYFLQWSSGANYGLAIRTIHREISQFFATDSIPCDLMHGTSLNPMEFLRDTQGKSKVKR